LVAGIIAKEIRNANN